MTDWYDEVRNADVFIKCEARSNTSTYDMLQVRLFSRKDVKPFSFNSAIGHFSQLVWAETYKVTLMLMIMKMFIIVMMQMIVTMFMIMMRVLLNDHPNDRLAAVLRPTAKVSATQLNCPHYKI